MLLTKYEELGLTFGSGSVLIRSELPEVVPQLKEFMFPVCRADARPDAVEVLVREGPDRSTHADEGLRRVPCFSLDRELVELPARRSGDQLIIADEQFGNTYALGSGGVVVATESAGRGLRVGVLRVAREILLAEALAGGDAVQLHACAVELDGRVLAFAGPRRAGKTTLLARLAATTDIRIVANDRLLVWPIADPVSAWPVPTFFVVREDTVARWPAIFGSPQASGSQYLTPLGFARAVGSALSPGGPLARLAVIGLGAGEEPFRVSEVRGASDRELVRDAAYGTEGGTQPKTVFDRFAPRRRPAASGRTKTSRLWAALAGAVECVRIELTPSFLTDDAAPEQLLQRLLDG